MLTQDSSPGTPIFVFLSPGVDVAASVEALGQKLGFTAENGRYAAVSLGQARLFVNPYALFVSAR
jgi:dynein heavy chain, axonemal